jgi:SAM-dependent methyltransferase
MFEYWESRFKNEGAMWKFEPSDSAILALQLFKTKKINHILIPGMGYGRNAKLFYENGFKITGIEISVSAIEIAKKNGLYFQIHHGSVASMPFDNEQYEGIYCYAMIHLLNRNERKLFLKSCYHQLKPNGIMIFVVASTDLSNFGQGKYLSTNRYKLAEGLKVFFYNDVSIQKEFAKFGLSEIRDIEEPVKFMKGIEPMKLKIVICKKTEE